MGEVLQHTSGPWEITSISQDTGNIGVGHRDLRIVIAEVTNAASLADMLNASMARGGGELRQDDCHTQFANARLIAAAPDLLSVLKLLHADGKCGDLEPSVRAIIAKATGEKP